ncbi:flagellar basal body P-ring formation chaperone FlgA [Parvibaculum sp.]|uniref:flagellar basal body P-ring formation chaperone FlgA n=1 Tax=Parvibaculum sp. TaxID=2024848 RepID=UPI002C4CF281|nr:flagellar basal body P-ring formation chaperone FlgA [Parvibaculum sp.]HUD51034.1 flagellar basal body P-ring formation chaperone FlgA [Parvibaculum sp.]
MFLILRHAMRIQVAALTAAITMGGVATADAAALRSDVTVSGNAVTLGDLFDDAGTAAHIIVSDAPAPGLTGDISISRISLVARRNGLAWHNTSGLTHVTVVRAGTAVPEIEVSTAIASAIMAATPSFAPSTRLQVDFANGAAGVQVGTGALATVKVEQIATNPRTGAFDALLRAPADDPTAVLRRVSGRAYPVMDVPVLTRDVTPGDVVRSQDIDWVRLPATRVSQNIITSESQLVGMSPRHSLRTGEPLRNTDVQAPLVVAKGTQVDMTYVSGSLTLTARGRALQSGAIGDTVDILNPRSNRTIQGTVLGPNMVRVDVLGGSLPSELKS